MNLAADPHVHRMRPPGWHWLFPAHEHFPKDLIDLYVGDDSLTRLTMWQIECELGTPYTYTLALPPGHPANIYEWPVAGCIVRVLGRLPRNETAALVGALVNANAATVTAWDSGDIFHKYPASMS